MARIRTIKPEFFVSEQVGSLPCHWRLLFIGLWTQADREGRLQDRPARLKALIFPYDDIDVKAGLDALEDADLIVRYEAEGMALIYLPTFLKHQIVNHREVKSRLPEWDGKTRACRVQAGARPGTPVVEGKGREGNGREQEGKGMDDGKGASSPFVRHVVPTIVQKRRTDCAFEGPRVRVPHKLHAEFVSLRNHPDAVSELYRWYEQVSDEWTTGARAKDSPGAEMFDFWRARYNEQWPPPPKIRVDERLPEWGRA